MQFTIQAAALSVLLKQCCGVASRRADNPTSQLLISVHDGQLAITAQNGSQQITRRTRTSSLQVEVDGAICAGATKLEQIAAALPSDRPVTLKLVEEKLVITCARSRFSLATFTASAFPLIEVSSPIAEFQIDSVELQRGGRAVSTCSARDDVRTYLNGMQLALNTAGATLVASDGHRLGQYLLSGVEGDVSASVIVPVAAIDQFLTFSSEAKTRVQLYPNLVCVLSESGELYSKLIEGKYPDVARLLTPSGKTSRLVVNRIALLEVVQRIGLMSEAKHQSVRLSLSNNELRVSALSNDNAGEEVLDVDFSGEPVDVGYNPRYLAEIIKAIGPAEEIEILFSGTSTGTLLSATDCSQLKFVLMPLRI
jgi:DNA polymerase-3 subunit beta